MEKYSCHRYVAKESIDKAGWWAWHRHEGTARGAARGRDFVGVDVGGVAAAGRSRRVGRRRRRPVRRRRHVDADAVVVQRRVVVVVVVQRVLVQLMVHLVVVQLVVQVLSIKTINQSLLHPPTVIDLINYHLTATSLFSYHLNINL